MTVIELDDHAQRWSLIYRVPQIVVIGSELVCDAEHQVVFSYRFVPVGHLSTGRHVVDPNALPFIANMLSPFAEGIGLLGEVLFMHTGPGIPYRLRARLPERFDRSARVSVEPTLRGTVRLSVRDPEAIIRRMGRGYWDEDSIADNAVSRVAARAAKTANACAPESGVEELRAPEVRARMANDLAARAAPSVAELGLALTGVEIDAVELSDEAQARFDARRADEAGGARVSGERGPVEVGARIRTVEPGTRHTGRVLEVGPDRCEVLWDGGQHRTCVELSLIELDPGSPGAHPPGTRVLAEAPWGGRQPATVRWFNGVTYEIEWDAGGTAWLGPGQLTVSP